LRDAGHTGEARKRLDNLAGGIAQAVGLVRNVRSTTESVDAFSTSTRDAIKALIGRVAVIHAVRQDIQMMSTNTHLRCNRLGEVGKPLGVIATELSTHARKLETSANATLDSLRGLDSLVVNEGGRLAGDEVLDEARLELSAQQLRSANDAA